MREATRAAWILFVGCFLVGLVNIVNISEHLLYERSPKERIALFFTGILQIFITYITAKIVVKSEELDGF